MSHGCQKGIGASQAPIPFWHPCDIKNDADGIKQKYYSPSQDRYISLPLPPQGAGIAQWLECRTCDQKISGSSPGRSIFFLQGQLSVLTLRYPFHPCVTTVTHKRSQSFCQKCRWQVTAKHTYTLCGFEWSDTATWCMVEWCTQNLRRNGSISHGTNHATSKIALSVHHFCGY